MKTFHFPLEKALEWRRIELELEEARYKQQSAELTALDRRRAEIEASGIRAEIQVREWTPVAAGDLSALGSFRVRVKNDEAELAGRRAECQRKLADQQKQMLEARRRCRLLERLKGRRLADWKHTRDSELEQIAAESYLSRWQQSSQTRSAHAANRDREGAIS
uniref:Flagellar FliJ protein n=1 Tax=Solibacter usitatus (strain Ellin6076) TaxID=234267 RepID=Q02C60_SOLUE